MKSLMTSTGATALMIAFAAEVSAQPNPALSDTSIRPADITCQDLMTASEEERAAVVYFIAGYQAGMEQGTPVGSATTTADASTEATQPAGQTTAGASGQVTTGESAGSAAPSSGSGAD